MIRNYLSPCINKEAINVRYYHFKIYLYPLKQKQLHFLLQRTI